jgi:hypothetical protein
VRANAKGEAEHSLLPPPHESVDFEMLPERSWAHPAGLFLDKDPGD